MRVKSDYSIKRTESRKYPSLADMPFGPLTAVLDLVEHRRWSVENACAHLPAPGDGPKPILGEFVRPLHEGLLTWTLHAARAYLAALDEDQRKDGRQRTPVFDPWVRQYLPGDAPGLIRPYEVCAWGRRYTFSDGDETIRELRIPVLGSLERRRRDRAKTAVEAFVLATGTNVDRDVLDANPRPYRGGVPFPMRRTDAAPTMVDRPPQRVRIVEVSCLDSSVSAPLFEGGVAEAEEYYAAEGRSALRAAVRGDALVPGSDCLSCKMIRECERLPHADGLFLSPSRSRPRRSWSVTSGRYFRDCPAKAHFRDLRLPTENSVENPVAVRQGRAVHAWLERLHARSPHRPCTVGDLPKDPDAWSAGDWDLEGEEARQATAMLAGHIEVCPFRDVSPTTRARVEQILTAHDREADVLALAKADLLYQRDGSWVYRELKTSSTGSAGSGRWLLANHPQLALAVLFFSHKVIPLGEGSAVELETLTPNGPDLRVIDPHSASDKARAREVIHDLSARWHEDDMFTPTPGKKVCGRCSYRRWCPSADLSQETRDQ
ncbi:PD-(D/E)XK nuclease family protein [Nocardiopsis mangrovi]|uniref:PD-(D/E)XK nuclease family protein n=1 Tax=Nocardiopsis mangrovi TaxID=1179818 RepID=A0ABV9E1Q2_9ACTN